jgi:molybdopterin-guanine dinucleotide biosynthesis protein A
VVGVAERLLWTRGRNLLCLPVDAPQAPLDLAARLEHSQRDRNTEGALAHDGQRLQPLFALLRNSVANPLLRDLDNGPLAVEAWLRSRSHAIVAFSDQPQAFVHPNQPEDLEPTRTGA